MNDNDGWRLQVHKDNLRVALLSKNGHDYTDRLPTISAAVSRIAATSLIIDAELTASGADGIPDFMRMRFRKTASPMLCVWAFDLLYIDGVDVRAQSLVARKDRLRALITDDPALRFSDGFDDGTRLLAEAERLRLEGIVSKRRDAPYRSGTRCGWIKVKCPGWRLRNRDRWKLFEQRSKG